MGSEDKDPTGLADSTPGLLDPAGPVLADAIVALIQARPNQRVGNASAALQALVDLIVQAHATIPEAVTASRQQHYSWDHIAGILDISPDIAMRRFSRRAHT